MAASSKPTVVPVPGAFADASGWAGVIRELQSAEFTVVITQAAAALDNVVGLVYLAAFSLDLDESVGRRRAR